MRLSVKRPVRCARDGGTQGSVWRIFNTMVPRSESSPLAGAIFDTIREPLLVLDQELRVEAANRAFQRRFRVDERELRGCSVFELGGGAWNVPTLRELLESVLPKHRDVRDFEVDHVFPALGRRIMLVNARKIEGPEGTDERILVAFDDTTATWRAERAHERADRELRRSNRELEEFAHAASHDLQEPLRKVRVFSDRLAQRMREREGDADPDEVALLERIVAAAERMQTRIDDLLRLARVSRERPRPSTLDLAALTRAVFDELQSAWPTVPAELVLEPSSGAWVVEGDRALLELVLQNVLGNAFKYRHPDRELRIAARCTPADAPEGDARAWIEMRFDDNGIGFEPQYAERIFGAFQRLHGRTEYEGSGVGLSIARRIAERHEGSLLAEGRPGEGATLTLTLPTTQESDDDTTDLDAGAQT